MINTNTATYRSGRSNGHHSRHDDSWEHRDHGRDHYRGHDNHHHHSNNHRRDRYNNYRGYDYGYQNSGWGNYHGGYGGRYGATINLTPLVGSVLTQLATDLAAPIDVATGKITAGQALENFVRGPSKVLGETAQALTGGYASSNGRYPNQDGPRYVSGEFGTDGSFRDRFGNGANSTAHQHAGVYYQGRHNTYYNSPSLDDVASGRAVMKLRDGGDPVEKVQQLLNLASGRQLVNPDGLYGENTKNAVKEFQNWLIQQGQLPRGSANGVVDQRTLTALVSVVRNQAPQQE